ATAPERSGQTWSEQFNSDSTNAGDQGESAAACPGSKSAGQYFAATVSKGDCLPKEPGSVYRREIFSRRDVVDFPGTIGRIATLPPIPSTVRRSCWSTVSRV